MQSLCPEAPSRRPLRSVVLASAAACGLLLTAGCNKTPEAQDSPDLAATDGTEIAASDVPMADEVTETVQVVEVPVPANTTSAEAAPLVEAAAVAADITQASDVERVPYEDGWAWRRNGQIVRTASRDGRRVSYFRAGEARPFLVQQGDRAYSYAGDRVQRGYDGRGRTVQVDQSRRQEGEQLARRSSEERRQAAKAADERPERVQRERPRRGEASPTPKGASNADEWRGGARDRPRDERATKDGTPPSAQPRPSGNPRADRPDGRARDRDDADRERRPERTKAEPSPARPQPTSSPERRREQGQ